MWAFLKSIPQIVSVLTAVYEAYEKWKRSQIKKKFKKIKKTREKVINDIKKVKDDDSRAILIELLNKL